MQLSVRDNSFMRNFAITVTVLCIRSTLFLTFLQTKFGEIKYF